MPALKGNKYAAKEGGKTAFLHIRITPELKAKAQREAKAKGVTLSEYVALLINQENLELYRDFSGASADQT